MKNALLHITIGVLLGVVVMQLSCGGDTTPVSASGRAVDGVVFASDWQGAHLLDEDGVVWVAATNVLGSPLTWAQETSLPSLPVTVDEIKFWMTYTLVTNDNVLWMVDLSLTPPEWKNLGPWPGGQ